jgi:hypothetical protein
VKVGRALLFAIAVAAASCAPRGKLKLVGQPVPREVAVLVRVSDDAAETDDLGGTAALVESMTDGLARRGVHSQIFAADGDHPPAPRIELWVEAWDTGDRSERAGAMVAAETAGAAMAVPGLGLVALFLEAGNYSVVCRVFLRDGEPPALARRYTGSMATTDADTSVQEGEQLAWRILGDAFQVIPPKRQDLATLGGGRVTFSRAQASASRR